METVQDREHKVVEFRKETRFIAEPENQFFRIQGIHFPVRFNHYYSRFNRQVRIRRAERPAF
jgi:hypothetical protein